MVEITKDTFDEICANLFSTPAECGGVLGGRDGEAVSAFYFDRTGSSSPVEYTPDYVAINEVLDEWATEGIQMLGMIHSHKGNDSMPSCGDLYYCEQILLANEALERFLLPIALPDLKKIDLYACCLKEGHIKVSKEKFKII